MCYIRKVYKDIKQNNPQKNSQKTMAFPFPRASLLSWAASLRPSSLSPFLPIALSPQIHSPPSRRAFYVSASLSSIQQEESSPRTLPSQIGTTSRWKPMCLYYTQGKCTKVRITPPPPPPITFKPHYFLQFMYSVSNACSLSACLLQQLLAVFLVFLSCSCVSCDWPLCIVNHLFGEIFERFKDLFLVNQLF